MSTVMKSTKTIINKYLFFRNVRYLLDRTGIKIGQLEKEANCNLGYMSRIDKEDNETMPSIEFIQTASNIFKINIDILLTVDLDSLTATEEYIIELFNKMYFDIKNDNLDYGFFDSECPRKSKLFNYKFCKIFDEAFAATNFFNDFKTPVNGPFFKSYNYDFGYKLIGHSWVIELSDYTILYLMQVCEYDQSKNLLSTNPVYETYIYSIPENNYDDRLTGLSYFTDSNVSSSIKVVIEKVTNLLEEKISAPIIEKGLKRVLDDYLKY